jgi:transcriptional regulator with XRE-family HTH domain
MRQSSRTARRKTGRILRAMGTRTPRDKSSTFGEEFGARLKASREERGFTLDELAEKVGMHAGRLSEYESGRYTPQLEKAAKLAEVLEVALDELTGSKAAEEREDVRDPRLRTSVRALEASGHSRYIEAAGLAVEAFVALARHEQFEAVRPRRRK